ncbi:FAD-dependent oxidoreductase [Tissierella sp. MB52-C2]|uniref:FAD-dependent oxidoreductase n=1 Tax=Tissierella sp. MB52-C2 TaxID=3070999 RepID=UPI00280C2452|nr:FAD-dependent oxidoreductase [Tissierella sp. MB52-C2]WMM26402.1 FAD-dependent oxidoreductase [Tissierella sp. MB52-C2]
MINNKKYFKNSPTSYWILSASSAEYPILNEDINVDVVIIGGGLAGIQCAYQLHKEGLSIAVLEANHIGHGTTGHTTGKITSQHHLIYNKLQSQVGKELAQQYATANETAIHEIKRIADESNIDCNYISQSSFIYTQQDEYVEKIHDEVKTASELGIEASYVQDIPFSIPIKGAIRFDNQAQFHSLKYLYSLAKNISKKGVHIYEQTMAVDIEENNDNYIITTINGNKVSAEKVIIASHYPFYNKHGMYFTRIYPSRTYITGVKAKEKYPGGMYINAEEPSRSIRCENTQDGELILVVGEGHKTGQGEDMNQHYEVLMDFANNLFTVEDIPFRWSTQDCMTLDSIPYIGNFTSNTPNLYIATGFQKWGMTNSTVASIIIRDLIIKGESPWADVYNPSRKTIAASSKNFIVENADVAKHLLKGKLSSLDNDINLQNGESKVLEIQGKRAGAYRDYQGKLHIVNTTCTHMGCELNWNSAESSWDCPCHGSRFSYEGKVLEGPATKPLKLEHDVNTIEKLFKDDF